MLFSTVVGEVRDVDMTLQPNSYSMHYMQGYIVAPGHVDVSGLRFDAAEHSSATNDTTVDIVLCRLPTEFTKETGRCIDNPSRRQPRVHF